MRRAPRSLRSFCCVLVAVLAVGLYASAQSRGAVIETWQTTYDNGSAALDGGQAVAAEKNFRDCLSQAEKNSLPIGFVVESEEALARSLRVQRRYTEAETLYRSILQDAEATAEADPDTLLHVKIGLGIALTAREDYREAEPLLTEALDGYRRKPKVKDCELAVPLDALTQLYKSSKQYDRVAHIYTEAFGRMSEMKTTPCENFAVLLHHLGELYMESNDWERVQKIQQGRAELVLGMKGAKSEAYGDALIDIAVAANKHNDFVEAAHSYARAAEIFQQMPKPALDKAASALEQEEHNLQFAGKAEEAKQLHPAVLDALKKSRTDDPEGKMMAVRADEIEAEKNGDLETASRLIDQEVLLAADLDATHRIIAYTDAGHFEEERGRLPEAEEYFKRVLAISKAERGDASRSTGDAYEELGDFYRNANRITDAEAAYIAALDRFRAFDTDRVKRVQQSLTWMYIKDSKFEKAEPYALKILKLAEDTHGDVEVSFALINLSQIYQGTNRNAEAEAALKRAMSVTEKLAPPMHTRWLAPAMTTAMFYSKTGRLAESEQMYLRIVAFMERVGGPDAPNLKYPLDGLIELLNSQGRGAEAAKYEARKQKLRQ